MKRHNGSTYNLNHYRFERTMRGEIVEDSVQQFDWMSWLIFLAAVCIVVFVITGCAEPKPLDQSMVHQPENEAGIVVHHADGSIELRSYKP